MKQQKEKELAENRRELKLRQKDLEKNRESVPLEDETNNISLELEKFNVDKTTKN